MKFIASAVAVLCLSTAAASAQTLDELRQRIRQTPDAGREQ